MAPHLEPYQHPALPNLEQSGQPKQDEAIRWPTEEELAYFEQTLPPPTKEQLLDRLSVGVEDQSQAESAELSRDQKIEHYLSTANIASWIHTYDLKAEHHAKHGKGVGFTPIMDSKLSTAVKAGQITWGEVFERTEQYPTLIALMKAGIHETCTPQRLSQGLQNPDYPGEQLVAIVYEVCGYDYRDGGDRPGNVTTIKFIFPESEARQFYREARKDPKILRNMSERYIKEQVLSEEAIAKGGAWDKYIRPPYEKWDARPNNVIAFRQNFEQGPKDIPENRLVPISPPQEA